MSAEVLGTILRPLASTDPAGWGALGWPAWVEAALVLGLLALAGWLSLAQGALLSANRARLRALALAGDVRARAANALLDDRQAVLDAISLAHVAALAGTAVLLAHLALAAWGGRWLPWVALAGMAPVLLVAEIVPKSYGVQHADDLAPCCAPALARLTRTLHPLVLGLGAACRGLGRVVARAVEGGRESAERFLSDEEIRRLVTGADAPLEAEERALIHGVVEFAGKVAREIMVPRVDMSALEVGASLPEAVALVREHGHSRIPLYRGNSDNIVGVLYARDLLPALLEGRRKAPLESLMRPAYFVPESKPVDDLLREMQQRRVHMAVVTDEYGGTAGLVTIEDLLEEIFGEIQDEYDAEEPDLTMLDPDTALVDARIPVDRVAAAFAVQLPESDEFDTLGGLVLGHLGRLPAPGETLQINGLLLTVEKVGRHHIQKVRVARQSE